MSKVTGKVELIGPSGNSPLGDAQVEFWPADNRSAAVLSGFTNADGTFDVRPMKSGPLVKPGRYVATVKKQAGCRSVEGLSEEERVQEMMRWTAPGGEGKGALLPNELDPKYGDPKSSHFEVDLGEDDNDLPTFKVEKAPEPKKGKKK